MGNVGDVMQHKKVVCLCVSKEIKRERESFEQEDLLASDEITST